MYQSLPCRVCLEKIALSALHVDVLVVLHAPVRAVVRASTSAQAVPVSHARQGTSSQENRMSQMPPNLDAAKHVASD